jgi:hypothetical protein
MPYKYESQLTAISAALTEACCPCLAAEPRDCVAYRLAYLSHPHPDDFLPRPLDANPPPMRAINIPVNSTLQQILDEEHAACDQWAISLFENPDAARKIKKKYSRGLQQNYIAELRVTPDVGDCTPTDHKQHFNLHEFADICLSRSVQTIFSV